jgi:AAA15 family ATPase/GTPase
MTSQVKSNTVSVSERAYDFPGSGLIQVNFERFKAFKERVEVDLAPITVIAGVNSGGKTTILQSLLLARQSLITPYRSSLEDALIYN